MPSHCRECLIPAAPHVLFDGLCPECVPEHLDIPIEDREYLDRFAIAACRAGGLNAVERPCGFDKCSDPRCSVVRHPTPMETPWRGERKERRYHPGTFTPFDAADLERFFRTKLPPAAWDHSAFGAMCQRIGEATNPDSDEQPTPMTFHWGRHEYGEEWCKERGAHRHGVTHHKRGNALTDIVDVSGSTHAGKFGSWEDQMAAYLDARHRQTRVWSVLSRLLPWAQEVLEARYGENSESAASKLGVLGGVALLTDTARAIRDQRARDGEVEWVKLERVEEGDDEKVERSPTVRGVLADLVRRSQRSTSTAKDRAESIESLARIRNEADGLLKRAETAYAREAESE